MVGILVFCSAVLMGSGDEAVAPTPWQTEIFLRWWICDVLQRNLQGFGSFTLGVDALNKCRLLD